MLSVMDPFIDFIGTRDAGAPALPHFYIRQLPFETLDTLYSLRFHSYAILSLVEIEIATCQEQKEQVAANERCQYTKISPPLIETDTQWLIKLITDTVGAVGAIRGLIVDDVPRPALREEGSHVFSACLAWRRGKVIQLCLFADHWHAVQLCGYQA